MLQREVGSRPEGEWDGIGYTNPTYAAVSDLVCLMSYPTCINFRVERELR